LGYWQAVRARIKRYQKIADEVKSIISITLDSDYDNETFLRLWRLTYIDNECWIHNGSRDKDGYGRAYYKDTNTHVHRISACLFLELDINNKAKQANHKLICPSKSCWNPDHIYIGTHSQNMNDSVKAGTHISARKTHCGSCGNEYDQFEGSRAGITRRCSHCRRLSRAV